MPRAAFRDRRHAGEVLAERLVRGGHAGRGPGVAVLALPRGGVPVAAPVAAVLGASLDVFVVRKLGAPGRAELALGAIASGGVRVLNEDVVASLGLAPDTVAAVTAREDRELRRREAAYRGGRPPVDVRRRTVVLVDDGMATGASMRAAVTALLARGPARLVVAVPVAAREACRDIGATQGVDAVLCALTPAPFRSVGQAYGDFRQTTDDEVRALLATVP